MRSARELVYSTVFEFFRNIVFPPVLFFRMPPATKPLRCLLTAGPTREHMDPVRFLSNGSSGKMGFALATAAAARGWQVDLVSGPVSLPPPQGVRVHPVVSAADMFAACEPLFPLCDLFIAVAAVADYRPRETSAQKQKKQPGNVTLELVPTVDILKTLAARKSSHQTIVGFAAETNDVESYAQRKLTEKRLDWIVANDVGRAGIGMNADDNAVLVMGANGARHAFGPAPKSAVADFILSQITASL
jgi:phosphopantothenoylcysteine synthetase/decarboxylase